LRRGDVAEYFDTIIVGGGAAGCIAAARLSEAPETSVLLLEAGADYRTEDETPPEVLDARYVPMRSHAPAYDPAHDWGMHVTQAGATIVVPQAKLIGGGSAINGTISLRGALGDFDEWVEAGNPEWSWEHILPAYRELENDQAHGNALHGRNGPFPISRASENEYAPLQRAFLESAIRSGAPQCLDFNVPNAEGAGPAPQSRRGQVRVSTAMAYLGPARTRTNLTVRGDSEVVRVILRPGGSACGVELVGGNVVEAHKVVLCAGALLTPLILQRSGIGPTKLLETLEIPVIADLPVGENLADHCVVPLIAEPRAGAWRKTDFSLQAIWRFSTPVQPGSLDGQLTMFSYLNVRTTGEDGRGLAGSGSARLENVAGIGCVNNKPRSTGVVRITDRDIGTRPFIELNYLAKPIDKAVMRSIVRRGWQVIRTPPLRGMLFDPIGFDGRTIEDEAALDSAIEKTIASGYHFAGSCRMAPVDRKGVVDQRGRVHHCSNLYVMDASVMPTVPAANTMLPTIMVAERLAKALLRSDIVN
jgi:choline dehydrogenase